MMSKVSEHMATYLSTQRATATAPQEQGDASVDDAAENTVEKVAAAIVATTRAKATATVNVIPFPKTGEAARDAMAVILAQSKPGHRLWEDA
jgi:predicted peptidase